MSPVMQRVLDVAIVIALTAAAVLLIVGVNSLLMSRGGIWTGLRLWQAFILRPDILGTMVLTAAVTVAYQFWQQRRRPGR
jgi:hypothetical protein